MRQKIAEYRRTLTWVVSLLGIAGVTVAEYYQPAGSVFAVAMTAIIVYAFSQLREREAMVITILCTASTVAGAFIELHHERVIEEMIERGLVVGAIALCALLMARRGRMNRQLEESERRYQALFDGAADGILTVHGSGTIVSANPAAERLLGYQPGELHGLSLDVLIPTSYRDEHRQAMSDYVSGRIEIAHLIGLSREVEAQHRDGTVFPIEINVSRVGAGKSDVFSAVIRDISERKDAERRIRESQRTLSTLMSNLPGMAYRCHPDASRTMLFVSQGTVALTGYEPHEIEANRVIAYQKLIYPSDREAAAHAVQKAVAGDCSYNFSYRLVHKSGEIRWVSEAGSPVKGHDGNVVCLEGFIADITREKRAEEALRESEMRFRSIADSTPLMIWASGPDKGITFANARILDYFDRTIDDMLGSGWTDVIHPDDRDRALANYMTAFDSWRPYETEYRVRRRDGEWRWLLVHGVPRFAPGGDFTGYIGSAMDVTERHNHIEALRESEMRFRSIADSTPFMIFATGPDRQNIFVNRRLMEFTGVDLDDLLGNGWLPLVHPDDRDRIVRLYSEAFDAKQPFEYEYRLRHADGQYRWIVASGVPRYAQDGSFMGYLGSGIDIHARKNAEITLRESEERFRAVADLTPSVIWLADPDAHCTFMNKKWLDITGQTTEQALGHGWQSAVHADDISRAAEIIGRAFETRAHFENEFRVGTPDGQWRTLLNTGAPRFGSQGEYLGFIGSCIDVTDRRKADQIIWQVARGVSAATGDEFFRSLALHLSEALGADIVSIGELFDAATQHVHTIAVVRDGAIVGDLKYELTGTPCDVVLKEGEYACVEGVQTQFPDDMFLREEGIECYIGQALRGNDGRNYGILWVLFRRPVTDVNLAISLLRIFVARAAAELERRKATEALRLSEQRFRRLFEDAPMAIVEYDLSGVRELVASLISRGVGSIEQYVAEHPEESMQFYRSIGNVSLNKQAFAMLGAANMAELVDGMSSVASPGSAQAFARFLDGLWQGCTAFEDEIDLCTVAGVRRSVIAKSMIVPGNEASWARVVTSMLDVTAQRNAEIALRINEARYRHMFDESPMAKIEVDLTEVQSELLSVGLSRDSVLVERLSAEPDLLNRCLQKIKFASVNATAVRVFRARDSGHLCASIPTLFTEGTVEAFTDFLCRLWKGETTYEVETSFRTLDGEVRTGDIHCVLTSDSPEDWSQVLVAILDVTESRKAEDELGRAKRLETAGRLAGQIAHDFNNLLGPLVAYPEILQTKFPNEGRAHEMLRDMQDAALQIAEINQELLTLSRRGHYNTEPLDLNKLVLSATRTAEIPHTVTLDLHLSPGEITICGGTAQLMRLLLNLIKNAVEAMEEVGILTVKTETLYLDEPMRGYATIERGEYARVDITDTGCGIPEDALAHIFEPFFTTKKADRKRGTGLGLPVVHSVVEDHNGYIDVVSSPGRGSTFSLYFPLDRAGTIAAGPVSTIEEGHGESVLVVDDDPLQRRIAQTALERVGYQVTVMESGEAAVIHIKDHPADIVILDMVMDGIDGAETLRRIRHLYPEQPAMILTGYSTSERAQAALGLGQCQLLAKPIQASALTRAIHSMLSIRSGVATAHSSSPNNQ